MDDLLQSGSFISDSIWEIVDNRRGLVSLITQIIHKSDRSYLASFAIQKNGINIRDIV